MPTSADMAAVLAEAQRSNVRPVEMRFFKPGSNTPMTLAVACPPQGEPIWVLSEGQHRDIHELWTYPCGDLAFVLNLVISECTGTTADIPLDPQGPSKLGNSLTGTMATSMLGLAGQTSTSATIAAVSAAQARALKNATMEGDLADMQVPNLLQSFAMGKMTGRLFIDCKESAAELFFDDGNLVHATALEERGESAISEIVTWETGKFYFYRDEKTTEQSIVKRLDFILMESLTLLDQSKALIKGGITMDTYLQKKNPGLSEAEFERRVQGGVPADLAQQKDFYLQVDGTSKLGEILQRRRMGKSTWVPILFNMMNCDLLTVAAVSPTLDKTSTLSPTPIDRSAIEQVAKSMVRADTGILSYPSFLYFLEQEFIRFERHQTPFSVILFDMGYLQQNRLIPFSTEALQTAIGPINAAKRQLDMFTHFEALSYAILMPHTEIPAASILANRIMEMLRATNLGPISPQYLAFAFGIAAVPQDCRDLGLLLAAAKAAKLTAQRTNNPVMLWKDVPVPT
ncbi:MAG: DUF4388 domain-containing protein [Cyanobacteria bacterium SZAS TMP-1]|nr:DUF4388 domain-containing protein [Cyanobacteria bacterium SZAS TMP-1]